MELPSSYANATFDEVLSDLSVRFIINLPQEELVSRERVCFQIEEAHWYYEDFIREQRPDLPNLNLMAFLGKIFAHNSMLSKWGMHQDAYREFMEYKHRVPVRGAILLNAKMDKVVLVKGWKAGASWAFPRGKINKDEPDHTCAVREVLEETGFDASELIDPDAYLLDAEGEAERHLQLYLIKNVPEDFKFHPLARKEISEVAWFPIADLQAHSAAQRRKRELAKNNQKGPEQDPERGPENKLRAFKIFNFLPGIVRWTKEQRRAMRQQARKKNHGPVYETEPESSAVETSPPRPTKGYENDPAAALSGGLMNIQKQSTRAPQPVPEPAQVAGAPDDEGSLSLASAKLREMIGIGSTPIPEQPQRSQFDKVSAGQSLLAQLQASGSATPTEQPLQNPPAGTSIPLSLLFGTAKQEPQKPQQGQEPLEFGPPSNRTSRSSNFNPSLPGGLQSLQLPIPQGPRNGYKRQAQNPPQYKPQVTILQRGQPLPDSIQKQPKLSSPVIANPPPLPPLAIPQPPLQPPVQQQFQPQFQPQAQPQAQMQVQPQPSQPFQPAAAQNEVSSPNTKMARRPVLTIDSFIPPNPAQQPSQEHKGNLLDILKGARPPPPAQPAMQLDIGLEKAATAKSSPLSLGDILAKQGINLPKQNVQSPTQNTIQSPNTTNMAATTEPKAPTNGVPQKPTQSEHLATLMRSLGNYTPKKITPPATISPAQANPPAFPKTAENRPSQVSKPPPPQALVSPSVNGFTQSPTLQRQSPTTSISTPITTQTPTGTGSTGKMPVFDRRATIKPEQANTLLGLFKSPAAENIPAQTQAQAPAPAPAPAPMLVSQSHSGVTPKTTAPPKEAVEKMVAPPMNRSGSLSLEQTAFLMNFLDTLATQHGV
ncbi:hypothetical protein Dda_2725 [Drechslerella dactyloides]|uniref:Nudix hydrolase domain-containing protein n=1 Tax=Drechslerella dactyloides TaxID=74499 RepID=A0AAD6NJN2_DREDA|nr:hypothetical protein Dda_2725 [Drechslerella dactyloides]